MNVQPEDLGTYMGVDVDPVRAALLLDLAEAECAAYVDPVPDTAAGIVLQLAASAYSMPVAVSSQVAGPFQVQTPTAAGMALSRAQIRQLRLLAGRGSAFSIDPTPVTAGADLSVWDQNVTWTEGVPLLDSGEMQGEGES